MKVLVAGATGATGRLLVQQLLNRGISVRAIARSPEKLSSNLKGAENLQIITASISEIDDSDLQKYIQDCDAMVSCLGHNLTLQGIYGKPRLLVTDTVRRLTSVAAKTSGGRKMKFLLMNTTANSNRDITERFTFAERLVISLLRLLLPPQVDNEKAAEHLRTQIDRHSSPIEWVAVRPDTLINDSEVSTYTVHPSPLRSPIFNAGHTSRINVGHFMAELITDDALWEEWKWQMPVLYNVEKK